MIIPGIDAGNSRFKVAIPDPTGNPTLLTNRYGEPYTPSAVYFSDKGPIVGTEALNAGFIDPEKLVVNWKRDLGTDKVLHMDKKGNPYQAKDILTILLKEAKADIEAKTGETVHEVVITVPANYDARCKQETIEAAAEAGLRVILLTHEPTAAGLGNELYKRKNATALVYDLGGGTFDVSLVRSEGNEFHIIGTGGISNLGGRDFNQRCIDQVLDAFEKKHGFRPSQEEHPVPYQELIQRIEQLKISLSAQESSQIVLSCEGRQLCMPITRKQFNGWVCDLVKETMQITVHTVEQADMSFADIDEVYAVGGGSMIPLVKEQLEKTTSKKISQRCEAHCAAALGAVVAGRIEYERQGKAYQVGDVSLPGPAIKFKEILSHSIGVGVLDQQDEEVFFEMLASNTPIPSVQTKTFKLCEPNQTEALIQLIQGENGLLVEQCLQIGEFTLNHMPPRPDLRGRVEITFALDQNGLLTARARDIASDVSSEMELQYTNQSTA